MSEVREGRGSAVKWVLSLGLLAAGSVNAQVMPLAERIDRATTFTLAGAVHFDEATTIHWEKACPTCQEVGPARFALGRRPSELRLEAGAASELAAAQLIPWRPVRISVKIGLIAAHIYFGSRNLRRFH